MVVIGGEDIGLDDIFTLSTLLATCSIPLS